MMTLGSGFSAKGAKISTFTLLLRGILGGGGGGKLFNSQVVLYSLDQHFGH